MSRPLQLGDLIQAMLASRPSGVNANFETTYVDGSRGESGRCYFQTAGSWVVEIEDGPTLISTEWASLTVTKDSHVATPGPRIRPPSRPPWSMVIPSLAPIFGRPTDDWYIHRGQNSSRTATLVLESLAHPDAQAQALVDLDHLFILELRTPSWASRLDPYQTIRDDLKAQLQTVTQHVWNPDQQDV